MWDTHLHCYFSGDSEAEPEHIIKMAMEKGLRGICFTDHLDLDYSGNPNPFLLDYDAYRKEIYTLKERYKDQLDILWGIELGLQPHLASRHRHLLNEYPFDFVIGSSHLVHHKDPYYPAFFQEKGEDYGYLEYFESILENLDVFEDFDVYGHLDYVVRYGPNQNKFYSYEKYADVIDAILTKLLLLGKGIEINTGGFKYGLGHPNPTEAILKRYGELGGEIISMGSDAHVPEHVAYDFQKVPAILRACGFQHYTVFENRKPKFLPLP